MSKLTGAEIAGVDAETVARISRAEIESFALQAAGMVRHLANQAAADSSNSSRPPSSDPPWRRDRAGKPAAASAAAANADKKPEKPSGKRPGMPGFWRRQPLVVQENVPHRPHLCGACHAVLDAGHRRSGAQRCAHLCGACHAVLDAETPGRLVSAHHVLELERGDMALRVSAKKHCYVAVRCSCGMKR